MTLETTGGEATDEQLRLEIEDELGTGAAAATLPDPEGDATGNADAGEAAAAAGEGGETTDDPDLLDAVANGTGGPMIPKARFDEAQGVLKDEIKQLSEKLDATQAQYAAALAPLGEPKDFKAERAKLRDQLDNGDLEDDEYQEKRDELLVEEAEYKAQVKMALAHQQAEKTKNEQVWVGKFNAWSGKNSDFMGNTIRSQHAIDLINRLSQDPNLSDEEVFARAEKELFEAFNWQGAAAPAPTPAPAPAPSPHAARNAADAKAQAAASATPRMAEGGMGERGRAAELDYKDVSYADWKKLSPEKQKELLGE